MAIKADFLAGQTEKRVSPLYQWDYGQTLEIESPDLSNTTLLEVHFACPQMKEAIVHVCSFANGVATVPIPDRCLEQSDLITAWVYEIGGTTGATTKVIYIPVVARTRPPRTHEIPQEVSDKYTELIAEVNEAVEKITMGEVVVAVAARATSADRATQADNASSAAHAESASHATSAGMATQADKATKDGSGKIIADTYATFNGAFIQCTENMGLSAGITYQFKVDINGTYCYAILSYVAGETSQASLGWVSDNNQYVLRFVSTDGGKPTVWCYGTTIGQVSNATIYFRQIAK